MNETKYAMIFAGLAAFVVAAAVFTVYEINRQDDICRHYGGIYRGGTCFQPGVVIDLP